VGFVLSRYGSETAAAVPFTLSAVFLATSLVSPEGLYAALIRLFHVLGEATAKAFTWLLLGSVYYGFFTPFGLLFRRGRRDRLRRSLEPGAPSYWEPHEGMTAASGSREAQY
jgi:hypothetical protein